MVIENPQIHPGWGGLYVNMYAYLISYFGDTPYCTLVLDVSSIIDRETNTG